MARISRDRVRKHEKQSLESLAAEILRTSLVARVSSNRRVYEGWGAEGSVIYMLSPNRRGRLSLAAYFPLILLSSISFASKPPRWMDRDRVRRKAVSRPDVSLSLRRLPRKLVPRFDHRSATIASPVFRGSAHLSVRDRGQPENRRPLEIATNGLHYNAVYKGIRRSRDATRRGRAAERNYPVASGKRVNEYTLLS